MSIDIRLPNITAPTEAGKLQQMQSYMYQLVEQLNWALNNIDITGGESNQSLTKTSSATPTTQDDPVNNFNSIKGLIIKSADIVNAYYEEIDNLLKLSGYYAAEASFPDGSLKFVEETKNWISVTDNKIKQDLVDKQTIYDENGKIKQELLVNGHIYSGIIEYAKSGEAIIGIEIGQTTKDESGKETFNKFARFTAEMLAFYDPKGSNDDAPVAYISGYNLHITNVNIVGSLKTGGYKEFIDADGSIVTKWVGG